ncbi:MAG TPA: hypothetical protein VLM84_04790, partial [Chromatiaceae bacterium]|nr:hypothetical protein [Chromatiaceae bacterium]
MNERAPRNLAPLALAFAAGVGALFLLPQLPSPWVAVPLAGLAAGLLWLHRLRLARRLAAAALAAAALGALWALLQAGSLLWSPFPEALVRAPLIVEGR